MAELLLEILGWWLVITVVGSLLSAFAYPSVCRWIRYLGPSMRSVVRLVYVGSAPVAALLAVVLVTQPSLAGFLIPAHCHGSQCGAHTPVYAGDSVILIGLASVSSLIGLLLLAVLFWALRRGQRRLRMLSALTHGSIKGYRTLDSADVLVCCMGLWRPQILLSRGLIDQLQPDELAIVLAHERAHAERLDNLRALLLRWLTVFWPTSLNQQVRSDSRADAEQACDLAAARAVAGPLRVAAVIRKLSELSSGTTRIPGYRSIGFDCDDAATRMTVLDRGCKFDEPPLGGLCKAFACLSLSWCLQIYLLTAVSHQMIEWLGSVVT